MWAAHLARETRMRQPPENFCVGRFCISGSKPRPARMRRALASAAAAPVARSSSYTWEEGDEVTHPGRRNPQVSACEPPECPLPSPTSRQLCHRPAPAAPEAVAPPPAALIAWCPLEEQPALQAFHPLPPLGAGRTVRPPQGQGSYSLHPSAPFLVLLTLFQMKCPAPLTSSPFF